jgi:hypothetical protein
LMSVGLRVGLLSAIPALLSSGGFDSGAAFAAAPGVKS